MKTPFGRLYGRPSVSPQVAMAKGFPPSVLLAVGRLLGQNPLRLPDCYLSRILVIAACRAPAATSSSSEGHRMSRLETVPASVPPTNHSPRATKPVSIGQYLIRRLQDYGLKHVFGIPGDYILTFYGQLEKSPIEVIGCTREDCAGFAADAY